MSGTYTRFIHHFMAVAAANNMGYAQIAEVMNVSHTTVRNWFSGRTTMDGEAVLRCIKLILGGYQC